MKTKEIFCASPGSTAVCSSINHRAIYQPVGRHLHRLPATPRLVVPCSHVDVFNGGSTKTSSGSKQTNESLPKISAGTRGWIQKPESLQYHRLGSDALPPLFKPEMDMRKAATEHSPRHQVVELRVSIHCKGCEAKVRKHISKMQGVASFSIDMATKKVTVVGDVSPARVLESISRVKSAELWRAPTGWSGGYYG